MKSIVFLGAKDIAAQCLQWLIENSSTYNYQIIGIGTSFKNDNGNQLIDLAHQYNFPLIRHQDEMPHCDYIISVQYHDILTQSNIEKAAILAINLHLAPIPEYRGCNQFSFAIYNQETTFGVTLHEITHRIDHGKIIAEDRFEIARDIWVKELWSISNDRGLHLFTTSMPLILTDQYTLTSWSTLNRTERLYYRKDINTLKEIDLRSDSYETIDRKIRACSMPGFPPPFAIINNKKIEFHTHE